MLLRSHGKRSAARRPAPRARLTVEPLDARIVPYALSGNAWIHPELVTLSFVPDGTVLGMNSNGYITSNLFSSFNARFGSEAAWRTQILKAAQVWAQHTNLNFTVIGDNGGDIGSGAYQQGDPAMGDIRIGGYNFGTSTLAQAYMPPPVNNYSIAGDFQFNTGRTWNIGATYDLFTVAMHEVGHTLGLYHSTFYTAAMYGMYNGIKYGPSSDDIAGIRAIYGGPRRADLYEGLLGNDSFLTATPVTDLIDPTTLAGLVNGLDITTTADVDYYAVVAPLTTTDTLRVTVQSQGLSLLSPTLTVYAADQTTVLATVSGAGQYGATLTATITGVTPGQLFYVKAAGADSSPFGTGRYALALNFGTGGTPTAMPPVTQVLNGTPLTAGGGQAIKISLETQVNTYLTGEQKTDGPQAVAMDANGNYVVVWASKDQLLGSGWDVYFQRYDALGLPLGLETRVNTTTSGHQLRPAVAMDPNGNFVVTWSSKPGTNYDIRARVFNALGLAQTGEIAVNSTTHKDQDYSSVAMDAQGNFVVTWSSYNQDRNDSWGVYARRFSTAGAALSGEFRVNTTTNTDEMYSQVAMDADGDFVITWSIDATGDAGVRFQRYNAAGIAQGGETAVNTYIVNHQSYASVATDAEGNFVVVWSSLGQDGSGWGIYAQRFDAAGVALGGEFRVNTTTAGDQHWPSVTMDAYGNFLVTWSSSGQDGDGWGVYARQYNSAGAAVGDEFRVNTATSGDQSRSSIAMDANGHAVVVWSGLSLLDPGTVFSQRYIVNAGNGLSNLVAPHGYSEDDCGHDHSHDHGHDHDGGGCVCASCVSAVFASEGGAGPGGPAAGWVRGPALMASHQAGASGSASARTAVPPPAAAGRRSGGHLAGGFAGLLTHLWGSGDTAADLFHGPDADGPTTRSAGTPDCSTPAATANLSAGDEESADDEPAERSLTATDQDEASSWEEACAAFFGGLADPDAALPD